MPQIQCSQPAAYFIYRRAELARAPAEVASSPLGWSGVGNAGLNESPTLVSDLGEVPDLVLVDG